ncbi:MAG: hypothetical protein HY590_05985 [Candidatus Omnitrophica bacterium]|nr:hypothetical protein [Candidatus Omnitrophota bacterium]
MKKKKSRNLREAMEMKGMYLTLIEIAARLVEIEERHRGASHFRKILEKAIREIDRVAHLIDREVWELRRMDKRK